jgi:SAM-dependent methyltransferase
MATKTKARKRPAARRYAGLPTPDRVMEAMSAYQRSAAIKAAIELDIFTGIEDGHTTPAKLALNCGASERGLRILCDYMVVDGFLTKKAGHYALAPDAAAFLSWNSPTCLASTIKFLGSPLIMDNYRRLTDSVKKGGVSLENATTAPEHPVWVEFANAMAPMMALPAHLLAKLLEADRGKPWKVLDVAAGHGAFGVALAKRNPNAHVTALDWPDVLKVAQDNAKAAGVITRHKLLPGSAFDVDFGSGYDLILLTNFLHHFDVPTNERLLNKVHAALGPKGRAVILDFVPNEDRVSPAFQAGFSLVMLASTAAGDAYTYAELDAMARAAGFARTDRHSLAPTPQTVIIAHKA